MFDQQDREDWVRIAKAIRLELEGGSHMLAVPKVFSTGSVGWHVSQKTQVQDMPVQVNVVITVIGSKPEATGEQKSTGPETPPTTSRTRPKAKKGSATLFRPE